MARLPGRRPLCQAQQEQRGDQGAINLQGYAALALCQPVATAQDAFEPFEKEFHSPAAAVDQGQQFGAQLFARFVAHQQQLTPLALFPAPDAPTLAGAICPRLGAPIHQRSRWPPGPLRSVAIVP